MLLQQFHYRLPQLADVLTLAVNLGANVQDHAAHVAEQLFQMLAVLRQCLFQAGEAFFLDLLQALQAGPGQSLEQLAIALDLPAEEVAHRQDQQSRSFLRPQRHQVGQRGAVLLAQLLGDGVEGLPFGLKQVLRIGEAGEGAGPPSQVLRREGAGCQGAGLAGAPQLAQALLTMLGAVAGEASQRGGGQEVLQLLAEGLLFAGGQQYLAAVPPGLAGQGHFQGLPGAFVGLVQGAAEAPAMIVEMAVEERDDAGCRLAPFRQPRGLAGPVNQLSQSEGGQLQQNGHSRKPPVREGRRRCRGRSLRVPEGPRLEQTESGVGSASIGGR